MDLPLFGDHPNKKRREINLGGTNVTRAHSSILQDAHLRRVRREEERRRQENASRIQAWWRGTLRRSVVKQQLRELFEEDVDGINGLRCLVLIGPDKHILEKWSSTVVSNGPDSVFRAMNDPHVSVLLRRASHLLLKGVSEEPQSTSSTTYAALLEILLSRQLPPQSLTLSETRIHILSYLIARGYHALLGKAISGIPISAKLSSPTLPLLVTLLVAPFSVFTPSSIEYAQALQSITTFVLTIPLLPNRIAMPSLTYLAPRLPLHILHVINVNHIVENVTDLESRIHLLANLTAFAPARYTTFDPRAMQTYLDLTSTLLYSLPPHALDPLRQTTGRQELDWEDSDSDREPEVNVVDSFKPKVVLPQLDSKTVSRLQTLASPHHLNSLLEGTRKESFRNIRPSLYSWIVALCHVYPAQKDKILGAIVVYGGGGLVRELYRDLVRPSSLGKDRNYAALMDPQFASSWPPLLFLIELYTQALLTMGDDEFFSIGTAGAPRNPLTLDELTAFSKQLLNIAFTLYHNVDQVNMQDFVPGMFSLKWEGIRERATKCLQAIHARDSRKHFTPEDHWIVTTDEDIVPFIEAAVLEEQKLQPEGTRPLSKRQIASMAPRLGVLNNIPFAIPFDVRVTIFRHFVANDMTTGGYDRYRRRMGAPVTVRRDHISQDGFDRLRDVDLKAPIQITFIDQFGQEEAGIDGGGVFKEFLTSLCKEVFDTDRGLWLASKQNELYPNPHSYATEAHNLNWYRFIGRILGKALYEGILVDVAFAGFFLAKWLGKQSFLDDLSSLDPELYQGLIFLKHYPGDIEEMSLNFTVTEEEFGVTKTIPLMPNGEQIPVTRENRLRYIYLVSNYKLNRQIYKQSKAFFEGLSEMIESKWLRMFNQQELQILLGGVNSPIDVEDLRKHTNYGGLFGEQDPTIQIFWRVVNSFDQEQRRKLLRFATSCSRPPLLGFKELVPNFAIRDAGSDEKRLPTASTCVNLLKLPRYTNERTLREKLLQAINSNAGFDLS
ncbi:hypothetical protein QCA50_003659 [Cerrena zonata]|uniref:HECT-type E3 ubiquitin transferase n=1 Tax=Cerrena zonata TaxID=2478898 RepID=A0AAW0GUG5_9APHY